MLPPGDHDGAAEAARAAVLAAAASRGKPFPMFRTLDGFEKACKPPRIPYLELGALRLDDGSSLRKSLTAANCHDGQSKLALALLEFLSLHAADRSRCHLVYVGASSIAAEAARAAFPAVRQTIFDPAPDLVKLMPPGYARAAAVATSVGPGLRGLPLVAVRAFYGDKTAAELRTHRLEEGERVLFVSDIRINASEAEIAADMIAQQRWAVDISADAYMFKFRIPYDRSLVALYEEGAPKGAPRSGGGLPYLRGDLYLQMYPQPGSAELRLIGSKSPAGRMYGKRYDVDRIENLMSAFNAFYRGHAWFRGADGAVAPYDAAAEAAVLATIPNRARAAAVIYAHRRSAGKQSAAVCAARTYAKRPGEDRTPLGDELARNCASRSQRQAGKDGPRKKRSNKTQTHPRNRPATQPPPPNKKAPGRRASDAREAAEKLRPLSGVSPDHRRSGRARPEKDGGEGRGTVRVG